MGRSRRATGLWKFRRGLLAVLILVLSTTAIIQSRPLRGSFPLTAAQERPSAQESEQMIVAAQSLQSRHGPLPGNTMSCSLGPDETDYCVATPLTSTSMPQDAAWSRLQNSRSLPRREATMTFDAADGYVILFGGDGITSNGSEGRLGDTWKFSGGSWTNITTVPSPSPRDYSSMAYDAADGYVLLFGGCCTFTDTMTAAPLGDTWKFSGGVWTNITSTPSPTARSMQSLAYDSADSYIVLFGGCNASCPQDTWKFSNGVWTNITVAGGPSGRPLASMTYDSLDGYMVLFGGCCTITGSPIGASYAEQFGRDDTWKFSGGTWTNITMSGGPPLREGASITFDVSDGYVLLFGGGANDTWKFSAGIWTNVTGTPLPSPRSGSSMAYDGADRLVVLSGGCCEYFLGSALDLGDTWIWSLPFSVKALGTPSSGLVPLTVNFQAIPSGGAPGYSWSWTFGDQSPISTAQNPSHEYSKSNVYTAILSATDGVSRHATSSITLTVTSPWWAAALPILQPWGLYLIIGLALVVVSLVGLLAVKKRRSLPRRPN